MLASAVAQAQRSDTAPPPLTAAEARARALLLETDRDTLAPPDWGVLQKPQPLVSPPAPAAAAADPRTPAASIATVPAGAQRDRIDPVIVAVIALGVGSLVTLLALAIGSLRRDLNEGPPSILPR